MSAPLRFRIWLGIAGLSGSMAAAMDAIARHHFDPVAGAGLVELIHIASKYQGLHALALVAVALLAERVGGGLAGRAVAFTGWAFVVGLVLFCGNLYGMAFGCPLVVPVLTPVGGAAFIIGWLGLLAAAITWKG